jgi:hypothetical protein
MAGKCTVNPDTLTREQQLIFINDALNLVPLVTTAKKLGFKDKFGLFYYTKKNPEFWAEVKEARVEACEHMEDLILQIPQDYDAKMAKVVLDMYTRIMAFRNPAKYSQRIDLNVNQTVSIRHNLEASNTRLESLLKDVGPAMLIGAIKP